MSWDYSKLSGRIREKLGTQDKFSELLGMSRTSLSQRLNNKIEFSQDEMFKSCEILSIPLVELPVYFFTQSVKKSEQEG